MSDKLFINVHSSVTNMLNINWDKVHPRFKFAAMDCTGTVSLFTERPGILDSKGFLGWYVPSIPDWGLRLTSDGKSILKAPVDWEETLTVRPAKVKGVVP